MGGVEGDAPGGQRPGRGRTVAAILALLTTASGLGLAAVSFADLQRKPTPAPRTGVPSAETTTPEPEPDDGDRPPSLVVDASAATVYDAEDHVRECASSRSDYPGPSGRAGLDDDVDRISESVERIRKLSFDRPLDTHLVGADEVGARFARGVAKHYSPAEAAADSRVLATLRLVEEGTDLRALAIGFAEGTAAGFYNPKTGRLFARTTGAALTPYDEVVLAHEIDHALVDQSLRLPGTLSADPMLADVMLAHQALAEGDATLTMSKYGGGTLEPAALDAFLARFTSPSVFDYPGVPYFLERSSSFPYYEGLLFACAAWRKGGWRAIDAMYRRPPSSTAEIVFPSRYRKQAAGRLPPSPKLPGPAWRSLLVRSFGVFDTMVLLENADVLRGDAGVAGTHVDDVRGWNGGVLNSWARGPHTLVHLSFLDAGVLENGRRRREMCGALRTWLRATFPAARRVRPGSALWSVGDDYAGLRCKGASVELSVGPAKRPVRTVLRG